MSVKKKAAPPAKKAKPRGRPKGSKNRYPMGETPPKTRVRKTLEQLQEEGQGVTLTLTEISEEFQRDYETIRKRITNLQIIPTGRRGKFPVYRLKDCMRMERMDEEGMIDPNKLSLADQKAYWQAEKERLDVTKKKGETYTRPDIEEEWSRVFKIVTRELDTLVDHLERDLQPGPIVLSRIEAKLDELRESMYQEIVKGATTQHVMMEPEPAALPAAEGVT